ncbi:MAG TPA: hypothetical protein DC060_07425, partial [Gemmatimonadetes bacterium]|nr:hypothetical protein [Gemmatimonadota bacterium]
MGAPQGREGRREGREEGDFLTVERATLGGGCFWCVEAVYQRIEGITKVTSGYMGGTVPNPTYKQINTGRTGHAEVVKVEFDPA